MPAAELGIGESSSSSLKRDEFLQPVCGIAVTFDDGVANFDSGSGREIFAAHVEIDEELVSAKGTRSRLPAMSMAKR